LRPRCSLKGVAASSERAIVLVSTEAMSEGLDTLAR
jgi:hypothetical protein